jgi:uncharacterized Zn finger protein (UPF0148 family)
MKLVEMKCKNCGSNLKVNPEDEKVTCQFCGSTFNIDKEVQHHKLDDAEQTGYELEKGKIRAREEASQKKNEEQIKKEIEFNKEIDEKKKNTNN